MLKFRVLPVLRATVTAGPGLSVAWTDGTYQISFSPALGDAAYEDVADILASPAFTGVVNVSQGIRFSGTISPPQITSDQNNYNPTGLATATVLRLTSDASRNITGIEAQEDGRILILHNVGAQDIVIKDESGSSTAANRLALTADITLSADSVAILQRDGTSSRWRAVSGGGGGSSPSFSGFKANKNSTAQTGIASATFTKVTFTNEVFDIASEYDAANSKFTPAAGKVCISVAMLGSGTMSAGTNALCALYKNGALFEQVAIPTGSSTFTALGTFFDTASGTDYYEVYVYATTSSGTITIDGSPSNTRIVGYHL